MNYKIKNKFIEKNEWQKLGYDSYMRFWPTNSNNFSKIVSLIDNG